MTFELEIVVPDGVVVREQVEALSAADDSGCFGVWPNHERLLTLLRPCIVAYRLPGGREGFAAADGGLLRFEGNRLSIVTRDAATADALPDVAAAAARMLESRRRLEGAARAEFSELQAALWRRLREADTEQ